MILFHGTNQSFDKIDLSKSKPNKDFGSGFYLSANYGQALELAQARVALIGGISEVLSYNFDEALLYNNNLSVLTFSDYSEEWARFILMNRNNESANNIHDYDIVIGPIADDRVGVQLWKFNNHAIDMNTLINNLKFMKGITTQYYFGTEKAISKLIRL